ncbi:MAG TPA: cellulase family glycosylhydrolase [Chloroflexia bacterium]|nr:cellulase family glycosylhydrolase [Chloroflexia bacterium]
MTHRLLARWGLAVLLLVSVLAAPRGEGAAPAPAPADPFASPLFRRAWTRTDAPVAAQVAHRSWTWGPGAGPALTEAFAGAPGGSRPVQYFDKGRMEVNPAVTDPASPWAATSGLLVVELVSGRLQTGPDQFADRAPADLPVAGEAPAPGDTAVPTYASFAAVASLPGGPDRRVPKDLHQIVATINRLGVGSQPPSRTLIVRNVAYSPETGHNIPDVFWSFMHGQGFVAAGDSYQFRQLFDPVFVLGYPITEAYWSTAVIDGQPARVLIQLYQRRVLTYVPGFATAWQVQMGNTGQHYYSWRYGTPLPAATPLAVAAPPQLPAEAFVHADGDQLVLHGQPVVLKGTNYWLPAAPFVNTWSAWDGAQVAAGLAQAHALGANSIRISIPYIHAPMIELVWGDKQSERVNGPIINLMTQLLQIADSYDMKVMFVLFDGTERVDDPQGSDLRQELNYVQGVVEPFAGDDRVLAWDLHNEPDNGPVWKKGQPEKTLRWLRQMAQAVHASDPHHPVTVGMGSYANLWLAPEGKSVLDFVDFASFHAYDAGQFAGQLAAVRQQTSRPIVVSEFGWPTGPAAESTARSTFDEPTQQYLYRTILSTARAAQISGVLQWTLADYTTPDILNHEAFFGLVRADGSRKPAAADFRDAYPAPPLPSQTHTTLPLTPYGVVPKIGP